MGIDQLVPAGGEAGSEPLVGQHYGSQGFELYA